MVSCTKVPVVFVGFFSLARAEQEEADKKIFMEVREREERERERRRDREEISRSGFATMFYSTNLK